MKFVWLFMLSFFLFSCQSERIKTYHVPKETLFLAQLKQDRELSWQLPASWVKQDSSGVRLDSYRVFSADKEQMADFSVISFPGDAGGVLANVNRWRQQVELLPLVDGDMSSQLLSVAHSFLDVSLFQAHSTVALLPNGGYKSILVGFFEFENKTYFFKLSGHSSVVRDEKGRFLSVLEGIQ